MPGTGAAPAQYEYVTKEAVITCSGFTPASGFSNVGAYLPFFVLY